MSLAEIGRLPAKIGANSSSDEASPPPPKIGDLLRAPTVFGGVVVVLFFAVLGGWAALAPLSSGAIAPGVVSPDSNRKVIQHLEGGIIRTVHVREGQTVRAGDKLITLESTRAEATFSSREEQWLRLLVIRARLEAQATSATEMVLPPELAEISDQGFLDFVKTQQQLFTIRQTTITQQEAIFERQIEQLGSEIDSVAAETAGMYRQIELLTDELVDKESLLASQLVSRSVVLNLQREQARLESAIAANGARIARANQSIEETKLSLLQAREKYRDQVAEESTRTNNEIAQIDEDMIATGDVLRRTEIVSPVDGVVLNFRNQTTGGVVRPGEAIMDVVPVGEDMIIIARLPPKDIDVVHVGLSAHVTLVPFASRNALPLNGEVTQVAADSTLDEATRQHYYEVRVRVGLDELARHDGYYMSPGMPADVTVVTGERTMLEYLVDPFLRSIRSAFVTD
jgi:HlyD family secretion protein